MLHACPAVYAALEARNQQILSKLEPQLPFSCSNRLPAMAVRPLELVPAAPAAGGRPFTAARPATAVPAAPHLSATATDSILCCSELTLVVLESWGDSHFVGLAGLEVLGAGGRPLALPPAALWASPPDLNAFPGHSGDCRTLDKLLDGVNCSTDDAHFWLAPARHHLGPGAPPVGISGPPAPGAVATAAAALEALPLVLRQQHNVLGIRLVDPLDGGGGAAGSDGGGAPVAVSALRVWNYQSSKREDDSSRGIKRLLVLADGQEVSPPGGLLLRRAPGTAAADFGQTLPLGTAWRSSGCSSSTSTAAAAPAGIRRSSMAHQPQPQAGKAAPRASSPLPWRPSTRQQQQRHCQGWEATARAGADGASVQVWDESVAFLCNLPDPLAAAAYLSRAAGWRAGSALAAAGGSTWFAAALPCGLTLRLAILSSWGDPCFVGLCGLEVLDATRGPLALPPSAVWASPRGVADLPGMRADARTPDRLVDGVNDGTAAHSWLAPLVGGGSGGGGEAAPALPVPNSVAIVLDAPVLLGALRLWNYARTPARGARELEVYLDEQLVWKGEVAAAPAGGPPPAQLLCFSEEACAEAEALRGGSCDDRSSCSGLAAAHVVAEDDGVLLVDEGQVRSGRRDSRPAAAREAARPETAVVC